MHAGKGVSGEDASDMPGMEADGEMPNGKAEALGHEEVRPWGIKR